MTAFAGALYCQYQMFISPDTVSGVAVSLQMVFAAVVGGIYVPLGPTVGAVITILLTEWLRIGFGTAAIGWDNLVYGALLVVFIIFLPKGILGSVLASVMAPEAATEQAAESMSKKPNKPPADELKPFVAPFRFDGSGQFHLKSRKTNDKGGLTKEKREEIIEANRRRLINFQEKLYAQDRWSMLLIFQGMDAAGKDSAIKAVFEGVNRRAARSPRSSSRRPGSWTTISCGGPRSRCPSAAASASSTVPITRNARWCACTRRSSAGRSCRRNSSPKTSGANGSRTLPRSSATSRATASGPEVLPQRLQARAARRFSTGWSSLRRTGSSRWTTSRERALWPRYMAAYQDLIRHTSTRLAPWYVVPADHKWFGRVVIGSAIVSALDGLDLHFPKVDKAERSEFARVREALLKEGKGGDGARRTRK